MSSRQYVTCPHCGGGFFSDLGQKIGHAYNSVKEKVLQAAPAVIDAARNAARSGALGPYGKVAATAADAFGLGGPKARAKRVVSAKTAARNDAVRAYMRAHPGVKLGDASKAVAAGQR